VGVLASQTAVNTSAVAATFFCIREYAVSPLLVSNLSWKQYETRRIALELGPTAQPSLSWSDLRTHNLLDTGISGALTGGLLNSFKRGRPGFIPGFFTGALVCTLLQLSYNELGIARVKYVSQKPRPPVAPAAPASQPSIPPPTLNHTLAPEPSKWWGDRILRVLGFQSLSDEELLVKLKTTRDGHLRRIEILEKEAEEKKRGDFSDSGHDS